MSHKILYFALLLTLMILYPIDTQAKPNSQNTTIFVRVCYDTPSCRTPTDLNSDFTNLDRYDEQVLANEWHTNADLQALKTGAIAIRTFAYRGLGCGAFLRTHTEPSPIFGSRLLHNQAQRYRLGYTKTSPQNAITANHVIARSETQSTFFRQDSDNEFACAKHFTNIGHPTQSCTGNSSGQCPGGSNDQTTLQGAPDPVTTNSTLYPGMSQNGSVAWVAGQTPWEWRQTASHYYNKVLFSDNNPEYRWVWLDVGTDIVFTGYGNDEFYGPVFNAPDAMEVGQNYTFSIYLQNTSTVKW